MQPMQVEPVETGGIGHQIAPNDRPLVVQGIQHPPCPVVVHLLCSLDLGIQRGNGRAFSPARQVVQGARVAEPRLGDQFGHHTVIQLRLLRNRAIAIHNPTELQPPQHWCGEHQGTNRPGLEFHLMQLCSHGSTSTSTEN